VQQGYGRREAGRSAPGIAGSDGDLPERHFRERHPVAGGSVPERDHPQWLLRGQRTAGRREETRPHSTEPIRVADRQIGENLASGSRPASTAGRVNRRRAEGGGGPAERAGRGAIQSPRDAYVTC